MSKASEWAKRATEFVKEGPPDFKADDLVSAGVAVRLDGEYRMRLELATRGSEWQPETALAFARWILDTFGDDPA